MVDSHANTSTDTRIPRTRRLLGGLVVALGALLLADTTGIVAVDGFAVFLAGALAVYGGSRLVAERARHLFWPGTFVLVGAGWLLVEFGVLTAAQARGFWPVLVVLFGASLLRGRRAGGLLGSPAVVFATGDGEGVTRATALFEDARLDLRGIDVPIPAAVEAVAVFDDVEVVVPENRVVVLDATTVFGGVRDLRRARPTGEPDLVIDATAVFGDVRIVD
ncbi:hypothetical protein ACFQFH_17645 [Halobaculum halobium]|uniref:Cell wall-active antibiotics response LiaF-like C-terminal domain-containing protein n=1 Tax=Halobaculum halobium TaxID=3032281 RepID=A0ABD5TE49_9EURY|nr:hypothetical protein [Halobaculum sp. SYNS20]